MFSQLHAMRVALLVLAIGCCFSSYGDTTESPLQWCVDDIPLRHEFTENGLRGPTVDFMYAVAERAGFELIHTEDTPFQRCLKKMHLGETHIMMALIRSPQREKAMILLPAYRSRSESLFMRNSDFGPMLTVDEIQGLRIGKVQDYEINTPDWPHLSKRNRLLETDSVDNGLALLFHKHIDILIAPHFSTLVRINHNPRIKRNISAVPIKLANSENNYVYLAFSRRAQIPQHIVQATEKVLSDMLASGEAEQILFNPLPTFN